MMLSLYVYSCSIHNAIIDKLAYNLNNNIVIVIFHCGLMHSYLLYYTCLSKAVQCIIGIAMSRVVKELCDAGYTGFDAS